ncbi:MAG: hypothetical protein J6Q81_06115 [Lentisphaeria bacterium]|nr:hypothetical protein [Lentisphaeria bacterium]
MDEMIIKRFVAQKLHDGVKLSDIQNMLAEELDCKMTFLDLRLMAAELEDVDWSKFDPAEKKADDAVEAAPAAETAAENAAENTAEGAEPAPAAGKTTVELSRLTRPGAMAHGTVQFGSGASAEWLIDEMGRLGLDKVSGEPTENDIAEFQTELRKLFGR